MLGRERLAAMPIRSTSPISKRFQGGLEAWEVPRFKLDKKSITQSERDKA